MRVPVYVWPAIAVAVAVPIGTAVWAASSALRAWRSFKRLRRKVFDGLGDVTNRLAAIDRHLDSASESAARLAQANARLQASLADARVLASAFGEFRSTVARVTGLMP
ncbi:MAG TPA: hypothetical protein VGL76_10135 [Gaiellaceae bacterium]|jgi:hypothetical protein